MGSGFVGSPELGSGPRSMRVLKNSYGFHIKIVLVRVEPVQDFSGSVRVQAWSGFGCHPYMWHTLSATLVVISHELTDELLEPRTRLVLVPRAVALLQKNLNLLAYFPHISDLYNVIIPISLLQLIFYKEHLCWWRFCGQLDPIIDTPSLHQHILKKYIF